MDKVQKSLLVEAQKHMDSDPVYAKELLNEVLADDWKTKQKQERKQKMEEIKTKYSSDIKDLKKSLKDLLGYMPSITTGPHAARIKFKAPIKDLPFDFDALTEKAKPNRDKWSKGISDYGKSMLLSFDMLKPLVDLVKKVEL